jgi:hypothetical protein
MLPTQITGRLNLLDFSFPASNSLCLIHITKAYIQVIGNNMYFNFFNVSLYMLLVAVTEPVEVPATE